MIQSEEPNLETDNFVRYIKEVAIVCLSFFVTFNFVIWIFTKIDEPEPHKPITPYEKVINPKTTPEHFLDGKTN